jgi:hypothetical protein
MSAEPDRHRPLGGVDYHQLLGGVEYDPLLGSWPDPDFDQKLVELAPPAARLVLKKAYTHMLEGFGPPPQVWDDWLVMLESFGPDDPGVQTGLMGLVFLSHETRHHLDVYATPLGWGLVSWLGGEYLLLRMLTEATSEAATEELVGRLRRHSLAGESLFGNVPRLRRADLEQPPVGERQWPLGTVRVRRPASNPLGQITTIQVPGCPEKALSTSALLEARAVLETAGNAAGKLLAADASRESAVQAVELMLRLGVDQARDDYWALINAGLPAENFGDAARAVVSDPARKTRLMLASWFGLHVAHTSLGKPDAVWAPAFRTLFALRKLFDLSDDHWTNPHLDWDRAMCQIAAMFEDEPLGDALEKWAGSCTALRRTVNDGELGRGVGRAHLSWLLDCCMEGLALRQQSRRWIDRAGWPEEEDSRTQGLNADPPPDARTAWSRLTRLHRLLRNGAELPQIQDLAVSLSDPE